MSNALKAQYKVEMLDEDVPVRGNASASGDDAFDKRVEDEIIARLEAGDMSAWFCAKVTAYVELPCPILHGVHTLAGVDYLGCCSYAS